jgi:hypothetical protein
VLYSIQWAVENYQFQYFARLGDDAYFRPEELYRQASAGNLPSSQAIMGYFLPPFPYETGVGQNNNVYPSGMGFVLTYDVCAWISASAGMLVAGFPEDAVVGAWLAGTKVRYIHDPDRFHDADVGALGYMPCSDRDLLVHHMRTSADWQRIDSSGVMHC